MKNVLTETFATEELMGIWYDDDDVAMLPGNFGDMGRCTNCARYVQSKVGGEVFGFMVDDNPKVTNEGILIAGGHDFNVVDERYIVDPWISLYSGHLDQVVFDLEDPNDVNVIMEVFGESKKWKILNGKFEKPNGFVRSHLGQAQKRGRNALLALTIKDKTKGKLDGLELKKTGLNGTSWAILLQDASEPGRTRYQRYDEGGFYSHSTFDDFEATLDDAISEGFNEICTGSLDQLAQTERWSRGMDMAAKAQASWG